MRTATTELTTSHINVYYPNYTLIAVKVVKANMTRKNPKAAPSTA